MDTKEILLELCIKHGLSREQLAERVPVTRQAVPCWKTSETVPNTKTLKLPSGLLEVSIHTLLGSPRQLHAMFRGIHLYGAGIHAKFPERPCAHLTFANTIRLSMSFCRTIIDRSGC